MSKQDELLAAPPSGGSALRREGVLAAARMFEMRETALRLFGGRYSGIVSPWKAALSKIADKLQVGPIQAALMLANPVSGNALDGMELLLLVCAATDLCESHEYGPAHSPDGEGASNAADLEA